MTELKGAGRQGGGYGGLPWSHEQASPDFLSSLTSGGCKWIRTPAIIYSVHTMTTLIPILSTLLLDDFSKASHFRGQGPKTSLGWDDPLEEGMATHSRILAWGIHRDRGAWRATVHGMAKRLM